MYKHLLIASVLLNFAGYISATSLFCYQNTSSFDRTGNGKYLISEVPAQQCNYYIYGSLHVNTSTSQVFLKDPAFDLSENGFAAAVALKKVNPELKVLVSVSGTSEVFSDLASDPSKRATFVSSVLALIQQIAFDGVNFAWEYPATGDGSKSSDKENYSSLIKELKAALKPQGLILSAAVSPTSSVLDITYDIPTISEQADFLIVRAYNYNGAWNSSANHNAPLYSAARFVGTAFEKENVNASIQAWLERGVDPSKFVLAVPFFGRTFNLSSSNHEPGAPTTSTGGPPGPYTNTSGVLGFNEMVEIYNAGGWTLAFDDEQKVPYAYNGNTWLSYDNSVSLALKAKYAKSLGLAAVVVVEIDMDDFKGLLGKYILLNAVYDALNGP